MTNLHHLMGAAMPLLLILGYFWIVLDDSDVPKNYPKTKEPDQ